ncbi:MAG: polysaccharide biosynthesis protein [Acidimicrobiales bacterium]|jgi:FlaA1/EpsC-like NDP-sugar epimerase
MAPVRRVRRGIYLILRRFRTILLPLTDAVSWVVLLYVISVLRFDLHTPQIRAEKFAVAAAIAALGQIALGYITVLYRSRWRVGSFEEARALALTVTGTTAMLLAYDVGLHRRSVPLSAVVVSAAGVFIVAEGYRAVWRMIWEYRTRPTATKPVIVYGAGTAGHQVIQSLLTDPSSPYRPVALLDDDPEKQNLRIRHVRVAGGGDDLVRVAKANGANVVIVAIPSAGSELIREVTRRADEAQMSVLTLPPVSELFSPVVGVADIRPLTDEDLLGRRTIDTGVEEIAGYLEGRRVLVTGAGGSIGSELCRQITRFAPAELIMLDRDESGLHQVQLSIEGRATLDSRSLVVCDIRDREALAEVFDEHRPEVVFHAAALKHLPLLEMWPAEAIKTNVVGTQNLVEIAKATGVAEFINISTDKAANPTSVLGYTKRIAERLTAAASSDGDATFLSVRFGNVLGSRGSVLKTFREQIKEGHPVTVTHPEVTRYFMTVEEAVQLVIQAGAIGENGEVLVLDMGSPVRIDDVARQLIKQAAPDSTRRSEIVYTGLRPGEKLHEELFGAGEVDVRPRHPLISHVSVPALALEHLSSHLNGTRGSAAVIAKTLREACSLPLSEPQADTVDLSPS